MYNMIINYNIIEIYTITNALRMMASMGKSGNIISEAIFLNYFTKLYIQ